MAQILDKNGLQAEIIPRSEHTISRDDIAKSALKVLYRLHKAGYQAYLVGGSVRDILLGKHPKDFDVATDATPEQARKLFSNSMIIGRRFRLVHVRYGHEIIELATFRTDASEEATHTHHETGMILRDNVYGDIEDDVLRRDFTVNALYYNIADFSIVDYVGGVKDIESRTVRLLGEPELRYREDPVRILRAIRFAGKLGFSIEANTGDAIHVMRNQLEHVSPARLFDEVVKMTLSGSVARIYELMFEYQVFDQLFPLPSRVFHQDESGQLRSLLDLALSETDQRIASGKTVNPAFLIAVTFWGALQYYLQKHMSLGEKLYPAMAIAEQEITRNMQPLSVPKRLMLIVKDIWTLQYQLTQTRRNRVLRCLYHPRFRAAYDFLLIRERAGEHDLTALVEFWTQLQDAGQDEQDRLIAEWQVNSPYKTPQAKPRRRRRRPKS